MQRLSRHPAAAWYASGVKSGRLRAFGLTLCCAIGVPAFSQGQPGAQTHPGPLLLSCEGNGVQVYRCAVTNGSAAWVLDHPDAELHDAAGNVVGKHFAGPTWRYKDGSEVVGAVLSRSPGKTHGDAAWLRLQAVSHHGHGLFTRVQTIERTETEGGAAPAMGCDAAHSGRTQIVPYRARYTFYAQP